MNNSKNLTPTRNINNLFRESFQWEEKKHDANSDAKLGRWSQGVNMSSQETR